jgi:alpha-1,3-rhamnosyl/mannosyltransferase
MHVLFNVDSLLPPLTGVGKYASHILRGLLAERPGLRVTCFSQHRVVPPPLDVEQAEIGAEPWGLSLRVALARVPGLQPAVRAIKEQVRTFRFNREFGRQSDVVYHECNHILQPFKGHIVLTVQDLSVLRYPEFHPAGRVAQFQRYFADSVRRADIVICPSEHTKRDLQQVCSVAENRIRVTPLGAGEAFRWREPSTLLPLLAQYGLEPSGYFLSVGTREPRKNLGRLLDAYLGMTAALRARFPLVLVGPPGWHSESLEARLDDLERSAGVRRLGYVSDEELPVLYAGSAGFVYPSLCEGFGLPAIEAAACGVPVLTARDSPMADVLAGMALLVDPWDVDDIRAGLIRLLTDPDVGPQARNQGPAIAAKYTWADCVDRTIAAYRQALGADVVTAETT